MVFRVALLAIALLSSATPRVEGSGTCGLGWKYTAETDPNQAVLSSLWDGEGPQGADGNQSVGNLHWGPQQWAMSPNGLVLATPRARFWERKSTDDEWSTAVVTSHTPNGYQPVFLDDDTYMIQEGTYIHYFTKSPGDGWSTATSSIILTSASALSGTCVSPDNLTVVLMASTASKMYYATRSSVSESWPSSSSTLAGVGGSGGGATLSTLQLGDRTAACHFSPDGNSIWIADRDVSSGHPARVQRAFRSDASTSWSDTANIQLETVVGGGGSTLNVGATASVTTLNNVYSAFPHSDGLHLVIGTSTAILLVRRSSLSADWKSAPIYNIGSSTSQQIDGQVTPGGPGTWYNPFSVTEDTSDPSSAIVGESVTPTTYRIRKVTGLFGYVCENCSAIVQRPANSEWIENCGWQCQEGFQRDDDTGQPLCVPPPPSAMPIQDVFDNDKFKVSIMKISQVFLRSSQHFRTALDTFFLDNRMAYKAGTYLRCFNMSTVGDGTGHANCFDIRGGPLIVQQH